MSPDEFEQGVDDLLADIHRMIDDDPAPMETDPLTAEDIDIDFTRFYDAPLPGPDILPMEPPKPAQPQDVQTAKQKFQQMRNTL